MLVTGGIEKEKERNKGNLKKRANGERDGIRFRLRKMKRQNL